MNDDLTSDQSTAENDVDGEKATHTIQNDQPVLHRVNQVTEDVTNTNEVGGE